MWHSILFSLLLHNLLVPVHDGKGVGHPAPEPGRGCLDMTPAQVEHMLVVPLAPGEAGRAEGGAADKSSPTRETGHPPSGLRLRPEHIDQLSGTIVI